MKKNAWRHIYGETPDSFRRKVYGALSRLDEEERRAVRRLRPSIVLAAALMIVLTAGTAWAFGAGLIEKFGFLPGAEEVIVEQPAALDTDLIAVTVEEAAFSGKSAYLQLCLTPKDPEKYALMNTELSAPDEEAYLYDEAGGITGRADGKDVLLWNTVMKSSVGSALQLTPVDIALNGDGSAVIWYAGSCADRLDSVTVQIDCWWGVLGTFSREDMAASSLRIQEEEATWLPNRQNTEATLHAAGEAQVFELRQVGESENGLITLLSGRVSTTPTESEYIIQIEKVRNALHLRLEDMDGNRIEMYEGQSRADWDRESDVRFTEQKGFMQAILPEGGPYRLVLHRRGNSNDVRDRVTVMLIPAE